jgi:hypothetical protein
LDMGFRYVVFEGLVLNWYDTFVCIPKKWSRLYLPDRVGLTMITLWVKYPHSQKHENVIQP